MKIATYNVRNLYDPGTFVDEASGEVVQEHFFNQRIAYFTEQLQALDLDIICFQEIGGELGIKQMSETLGYDYFFAKPNRRGIRMAVMYKKALAPMISCESVSFRDLSVPSIQERGDTSILKPITQRRDILEITLTIQEKTISINTFHLKSNLAEYLEGDDMEQDMNAFIDAKFRCIFYKTLELSAIRRHAEKRLQEGKQIMLLGDYNETNIASIMDILKGSQKRDSYMFYDLLVGYEGEPVTHFHRGSKLVFDTIIATRGIQQKTKKVSVENKGLRDYSMLPKGAIEHEIESDHALVWADIEL